jgi:hypothetical protein
MDGRKELIVQELIVQDDTDKRTMDVQTAAVLNQAEFFELVHKETDPRPGGTHHLRERFLAYLRNNDFGLAFFSEVRQQEKDSGQTLLA